VAGVGTFGGSSYWMRSPEGVDTLKLAEALKEQSVLIEPGAPFCEGTGRIYRHYRLAYSSISAAQIAPGIAKIAETIAQLKSKI